MRIPSSVCVALALIIAFSATPACAEASPPSGMAGKLIGHFHMRKVPQEGCWFSLSYLSTDQIDGESLPARYASGTHPAGNAILALETARDFSALHRLQTDEVWHFYDGSPIDMLLLYPDGHGEKITLGPNVLAGQRRQFTVPHGVWQGSAPHEKSPTAYSFFADQLSPGFDYADFEIGYRDALQRQFPAFARDIQRLTRAEFALSPTAHAPPANVSPPGVQPARAKAFSAADIPAQAASPGVDLKELVGAKSPLAPTSRLSVAQFTLAPGHSSGTSFNHHSQEVFVVLSGTGRVSLQADATAVGPGSTVFIPAMQPHSIAADAAHSLVFLAISAPAFTPEDYMPVQP